MIADAIRSVVDGDDLQSDTAAALMDAILENEMTPAQFGALVTGLRLKGESAAEIAGFAASMTRHALSVDVDSAALVDTCGTGGGRTRWVGVSTAAAFVAAGAGAVVAKHGNRGVTRPAGSGDVLEELGVNLMAGPDLAAEALAEARVAFMFALAFHPAMRFAGPLRREIGIRTVFNILGPLTNPAGAQRRLLGVGDPALVPTIAEALRLLEIGRALVMHGHAGVDEISLTGPTRVFDVSGGAVTQYEITPSDFGLPVVDASELETHDAAAIAAETRELLAGRHSGPRRDVVLANASGALVAAGIASDWRDGVSRASDAIESGAALACLDRLVEVSNRSDGA
ncbi:MAG: anthranilate phosphoribosyltransferase [Chloroflexota bacterium]|nr:anthranilate phosphoribosyltransferase [Chloroflexota bacterium]MDE2899177.1 anthranilate phosphoribosyltransferase [Chloroflexota bacterium]